MFNSKLPDVGTTIFSVMSALANEHRAINLSQGFPDFSIDPELNDLVCKAVRDGHNQYAPMIGLQRLRKEISALIEKFYGRKVNPDSEITVTSGATEALFASISVVVRPGDEVIMFDPAYDSYEPAILLNQGKPVRIPLTFPEYEIDWNKVYDAVNERTRLIIINSPNNPTGSSIGKEDIRNLREMVHKRDIYIVSDEVYEHIIFDGKSHYSMLLHDDLFRKSFIISSFGKTFHVTGWKVGYCIAPENLTAEFRKIHQFLTFSTSTPFQYAIAHYLKNTDKITNLRKFYMRKRDYFRELISGTNFTILNCSGTYFQLLGYPAVSNDNDFDFAVKLTKKYGVASIPISVFYKERTDHKVLRFCFAKEDKTLRNAAERLYDLRRKK